MKNCYVICKTKDGRRWLLDEKMNCVQLDGFGPKKKEDDFVADKIVGIRVVGRKGGRSEGDLIADFSCLDNLKRLSFENVNCVYLRDGKDKLEMGNLEVIDFCEQLEEFDMELLKDCHNLKQINFNGKYWNTDFYWYMPDFFGINKEMATNSKFPVEWRKALQFDIVAHIPSLVEKISIHLTEEDCNDLFEMVREETAKRACERAKTESNELVVATEARNLERVGLWINKFKPLDEELRKQIEVGISKGLN